MSLSLIRELEFALTGKVSRITRVDQKNPEEPKQLQLPVCHSCSQAVDNECWILLRILLRSLRDDAFRVAVEMLYACADDVGSLCFIKEDVELEEWFGCKSCCRKKFISC